MGYTKSDWPAWHPHADIWRRQIPRASEVQRSHCPQLTFTYVIRLTFTYVIRLTLTYVIRITFTYVVRLSQARRLPTQRVRPPRRRTASSQYSLHPSLTGSQLSTAMPWDRICQVSGQNHLAMYGEYERCGSCYQKNPDAPHEPFYRESTYVAALRKEADARQDAAQEATAAAPDAAPQDRTPYPVRDQQHQPGTRAPAGRYRAPPRRAPPAHRSFAGPSINHLPTVAGGHRQRAFNRTHTPHAGTRSLLGRVQQGRQPSSYPLFQRRVDL